LDFKEVNMDVKYENKISINEFNFLRKSVGWFEIENSLARKSIENALFIITAVIDGKVIGLTRVSGDGGYTLFITDVIVLPEYQGKGIGKTLMVEAIKWIKNQFLEKGQQVFVNLMATRGKEPFYKKFGFEERPNEKVVASMTKWIK
jgi:GNAT superfamily N-acetyltransferase